MASPIYHSGFLKAANLHDGAQVTVFFQGSTAAKSQCVA